MEKLFIPGDILLPKNTDLALWSVIACDQFTSQPEYWDALDARVGEAPSSLRLILPEAYLESRNITAETLKINETMNRYLAEGLFETIAQSYIYVERQVLSGTTRRGLVGLIDLEAYDYRFDSRSPVHATERTVEDRLPPRVEIRREASLELPHIVVLIDDPENKVLHGLSNGEPLYDFTLMDGGGHIRGCRVSGEKAEGVEKALAALSNPAFIAERYGLRDRPPIAIAMGDGNHSLATARLCWETIREGLSEEEKKTHPARFGLAELINIHDETIVFEPIHRVIFDTDPTDCLEWAKAFFTAHAGTGKGSHSLRLAWGDRLESIEVKGHTIGSLIAKGQEFCTAYLAERGGRLDYIHDDDTTLEFSRRPGTLGLLLPAMDKNELFPSIMESGVFPAKSFSIGPARDKRYYLECRKIK